MRAPYVLLGLLSLEYVEVHISVDASVFASTDEIKHLVHEVCKDGLRLPGTEKNRRIVDFLECALSSLPDMKVVRDGFEIAGWTPNGETLHAQLISRLAQSSLTRSEQFHISCQRMGHMPQVSNSF
jgi:hypothetical protein